MKMREKREEGLVENREEAVKGFPVTFLVRPEGTGEHGPEMVRLGGGQADSKHSTGSTKEVQEVGKRRVQPASEAEAKEALLDVLSNKDIDLIQTQNMQSLDKLTPKEIEEQQQILMSLLSKSSIDILKNNQNYMEKRKEELEKQRKHRPVKKVLSEKEAFLERDIASNAIKEILPGISDEFFEENKFEGIYFKCYFSNEGVQQTNLSKEDIESGQNHFNFNANDEYHTLEDLTKLMDSTHQNHVLFGLDKMRSILSGFNKKDLDLLEFTLIEDSVQRVYSIPKMLFIKNFLEKSVLDQRLAFLASKKNVNLFSNVLEVLKELLEYLYRRMLLILAEDVEFMQRLIGSIIGTEKDKQVSLAFLHEDFLQSLHQRFKVSPA